jgi:hypothetical protein
MLDPHMADEPVQFEGETEEYVVSATIYRRVVSDYQISSRVLPDVYLPEYVVMVRGVPHHEAAVRLGAQDPLSGLA